MRMEKFSQNKDVANSLFAAAHSFHNRTCRRLWRRSLKRIETFVLLKSSVCWSYLLPERLAAFTVPGIH